MGLSGLLRSVKRHRWLAVGIFVASQLVTVAFWFVMPQQYKATAKVLIPGSMSPGRTVQDDPHGNILGSRIAMLQSRVVTDRVLNRLGLNAAEPLKEQWERVPLPKPSFENWLATVISGGLLPEITPKSFILSVSYISTSPEFASGLANAYAAEFVEAVNAVNQRNDQSVGLASEQGAKNVLRQMQDAHQQILKLGRQAGVTQEGFLDSQVKGFYGLSRLATMNLRASLEQDSVVGTLAGIDDYGSFLDDEFLKDRRQLLATLTSLQSGNLASKGASHPDSVRIKAVIALVQKQIADHERQRNQMVSSGAQIQGKNRLGMTQEGEAAQGKLLASASSRLDYDRAVERFDTLGDKYVEMRTDGAIIGLNNEASKSDMLLIQAATVPVHPWFPLLIYVIPISLTLGLVCMLVACGIAGSRYPAIASTQDLSAIVGAAAIGRLMAGNPKS